jgi:hypothetical protein
MKSEEVHEIWSGRSVILKKYTQIVDVPPVIAIAVRTLLFLAFLFSLSAPAYGQRSARTEVLAALDTVLPKLKACTKQVAEGHGKWCKQSTPASISNKIVEDHSIRITVKFEPRPIGGILSVTADLIPAFSGIGVPVRTLDSRSVTAAVDALIPDEVEMISRELVDDLSKSYAFGALAKTEMKTEENGMVVIHSEYHFSPHTRARE